MIRRCALVFALVSACASSDVGSVTPSPAESFVCTFTPPPVDARHAFAFTLRVEKPVNNAVQDLDCAIDSDLNNVHLAGHTEGVLSTMPLICVIQFCEDYSATCAKRLTYWFERTRYGTVSIDLFGAAGWAFDPVPNGAYAWTPGANRTRSDDTGTCVNNP